MRRRFTYALVTGLALAAAPAAAQMTQADSAAVLLGVATRLRAEGRNALANSMLDLILERWGNTPAAAEARTLRGELRTVVEERSGKTELLVFTTTYGLALGVMIPPAFEANDPEAYGLGLIAGGPAGYFLGRSILRSRSMSEGQARAISFGTIWGAWQGFGWANALDIGVEEECDPDGNFCFESDVDGKTLVRGTILGSMAGLATGLFLSRKEIPAGTATTVNFGALWGTWYGFALNVLLADEDNDIAGDDDTTLIYSLIGGDAGLLLSALAAPHWHLSRARARLISISGVAGGLAGLGLILILQPDGDEDWVALPMATSAAGLALGVVWTRNYDERNAPRVREGNGGALLELDRGLRLGVPTPGLRLIDADRSGRRKAPALAIPLLKATF
ncbi:MAG TPA: hypothetical protein VK864_06670 [Longimicrobiales bacterium]|nr:hypothetical protein [Longimicrobiales bacterium]